MALLSLVAVCRRTAVERRRSVAPPRRSPTRWAPSIPGLVVAAMLLGLFGLGFGVLVKNQVAGILVTIGGTFILEPILVALARASSTTT